MIVVSLTSLVSCESSSGRDPTLAGPHGQDTAEFGLEDEHGGVSEDGAGEGESSASHGGSEGASESGAESGAESDAGSGAASDDAGSAEDGGGTEEGAAPAFKWDLGGTEGEATACQAVSYQPIFARPKVMLVLDRSGSMKGDRWATLTDAVQALVGEHGDTVDFGLRFFPQVAAVCSEDAVDIPVGPSTGPAILGAMSALAPLGNTPTRPAILASALHLQASALDPTGLLAPQRMILVADGDANDCGDVDEVTAAIQAAWNAGIPTNVVAVASGLTAIDAWAMAGGTLAPVAAEDLSSLSAALASAVTSVKACAFALDPAPIWPSLVELELDGVELPRVESCAMGDGFRVVGGPPWSIELCTSACAGLQPETSVDVTYRCPPG